MTLFISLVLFFLIPSNVWGYVPHEYPAIYTHQLARIFLLIAFTCVFWVIIKSRLYKQKGWRYLFISLIFFILWDLDVFFGRIAEYINLPQTIGSTGGWKYFTRHLIIEGPLYLYYIGRLDFIFLNIAMLFFYIGLKEHLKEEKKEVKTLAILPLLPILINDITGNVLFIVLSLMSLNASISLYKKERENVLWNYMVWLSSSWVMFSISRSFGHILRHILIPTGNEHIWKIIEPFGGSFNTFACFLVGSLSLFFIRIYKSYLVIIEDKGALEKLVDERTLFIEQLERDKMELRELDKMKSAFLANISHELRTPMNTILGYTDLLLDRIDGPVNEEQEKSLRKIGANARHLQQLINDVLDVSKIEAGKIKLEPKDVDIKWLIDSVIPTFEPLLEQKNLTLTVTTDENLPLAFGDEDRIRHILINLLSNAVKFTHKGGITITAKPSEQGIRSGETPLFAEICVADTGIGIKGEDLERIFDKFFQVDLTTIREYEGAGLGLSIAKGLVELHRGMLWATSKYGEGSTFCFTIPLKKEILEKPVESLIALRRAKVTGKPVEYYMKEIIKEEEPVGDESSGGLEKDKKTVLSIDDNPEAIDIIRKYLGEEYRVVGLQSSEKAVERAKETKPLAITLDILMPKKDGWQVLRELKNTPETQDIPVIILSIVDEKRMGFSLGAAEYIVKPVEKQVLLRKLKSLEKMTKIRRVLVVDNEPETVRLIGSVLKEEGYQVVTAYNSKDAIRSIQDVRPDLIVLNLTMPEVSGFDVIEYLKTGEGVKDIPLIVLTRRDLTEEEMDELNGKIQGIINKGILTKEDLLKEIKETISKVSKV